MKTITYTKKVFHERESPVEYGLEVEVTDTSGVTPKIFVWQARESGDVFVCVASPADIEEVPEDDPDIDSGMPYYRTGRVSLIFRNYRDFEKYSRRMDDKIAMLSRALNGLENNTTTETITV